MTQAERYDLLVVGAGQAGAPLATAAAKAGKRTALVERSHVGGTCINEGCTPTKTMVASARAAYVARRSARYGVHTGDVRVDMGEVRQRKRDMVDSFRSSGERRVHDADNLDFFDGEAAFVGEKRVEVRLNDGNARRLAADVIVLNTGGRPSVPDLPGLDTVPFLNSTTIMELDAVPEHLLVIGGGYIGLEFGQMFRRFGSRVTIVQRGGHLLSNEDDDVAEAIDGILREDGIDVLLDASTRDVRLDGDSICLTVEVGGETRVLAGSHLLVAVGRTPNTDGLNLSATGVETDRRGMVRVDERLETTCPGIYAAGDVTGGYALTHMSYDDFRILRTNLLEGGSATTRGRVVPYTVFIDPQLGRVGMTETHARREGRAVRVASLPMDYVARALEVDEARGFIKAVVDDASGRILGAAVLGIEGGELMAMIQIAMLGNLHYTALRDGIFAHPTLAESLNNLFGSI